MEGGDSVLDALFEDGSFEDEQDAEMMDVEEGELIEQVPKAESGESSPPGNDEMNRESRQNRNQRRRKNKKKNKRKGGSSGQTVTDINKFVIDVCRRLREKKSYLVWTAVGCLGVSALSDLVKEVDAIQACGGQKTLDGRRFRSGGGILWNILKVRDPNIYKEIMQKGKEFEKQFKQQNKSKQESLPGKEASSQNVNHPLTDQVKPNILEGQEAAPEMQSQIEQVGDRQKRAPVQERIRMPVSYDDLLVGGYQKDESS